MSGIIMKANDEIEAPRMLGRLLARELTPEEMDETAGGGTMYSETGNDCDADSGSSV